MSATTLLLQSLDSSRRSMLDAVRDFSAPELAHRAGPRCRSCGQVLGSAAVADREVLRYLGVDSLPTVPAGFEARFARWGIGDDDGAPSHGSLPEKFASHRDVLIRAVEELAPDALDEPVDPPEHLDEEAVFRFETVGEMIMATAGFTHSLVGEVSVIRLALGMSELADPFGDPGGGSNHVG